MNYFYNNFLTPVEIDEIHDAIFNINFPWHYAHENTVSLFDLNKEQKNFSNILDYYQICHVFYSKYSKYSHIPNGIINKLNLPNKILRAKVNLQGQNIKATTETYNCPHTDMDEPHLAAIYYVNDSDGFTFLFDYVLLNFFTMMDEQQCPCQKENRDIIRKMTYVKSFTNFCLYCITLYSLNDKILTKMNKKLKSKLQKEIKK